MSTTIDQRVVEMRFDNQQFEENVKTSMSTLDKLKQSLNLTGASKGLENISAAAKNCDMSGLSGAVETVRIRFSALEVMAVTALANITNSAINAGKRIVSALTIDPIKTGFSEYETQINAIQTILANTSSKGTTLEQVNSALDELNKYADKTIYNFTEMTRNIGTFTAAGVDLDTSVQAIKGIANLAAISGSTSQQASTAMYQLSQALASGTVKLMDWNSVVNAGMGGQVFQDALKETARVHGIAIDQMIKDEGSFRETLQKGWLTSEILTETLAKFTGDLNEDQLRTMGYTDEQIKSIIKMGQTANDAATKVKTFTQLFDTLKEAAQSGWAQSWEIIVGDFEEAKELLTEISDIFGGLINESADARNAVLQGWKDLGGRTQVIEALRNTFEGIMSIITPVKEAFREIFPPITAEQLYAFSEGLRKLTEHLKLSETTSANLKSTFKGLFAILDIIKRAFSAVLNAIKPLFGSFGDLGGGILSVTGAFGNWLVKLDETIKTTDIFNKAVQGVADFIKMVATAVKDFVKLIAEKFDFPGFELFHSLLERVHERMAQVGEAAGEMKSGVVVAIELMGEALANSKFLQALEALWKGIKTIAGGIASALGSLTGGLVEKIGNADFKGILDIVNSLIAGGIGIGLMKFLKSATDTFKGFRDITDGIVDIFDGVRGALEAYQTQLKAGTLLKIASAIGILAASILVISLIDSEKLTASLGAITVLFADLMGSMALFGKISGNLTGVFKTTTAMIGLSVAVLILTSALKKIGELDFNEMVTGLIGVLGLTATMVAAAKIMGSGSSTIIKGATQMVIFAAAIKILASACEDLSQLSWGELAKGLVGVGALMAEISLFLNTAKFSGKSITTATGIVILAAAIKILASACEDFGQMEWGEIGKGLLSIGALLTEITLFTNLTGNAKHVISTGVALIAIGAAIKIFASAVQDMSSMNWEELTKGLIGIAGALAAVTLAVNFMPKNMVGIGVGLIAVSIALVIMSGALDKLGGMSWEGIAKGLVALGGSMVILAVGLNAMTGTLPGSAALLVAVAALAVLTPVLSVLGAMSWEGIAKGLVAIAGAFAVIGVAGLVLTPLVPTILGLGAAFTLIGIGVLGIGAGLLAAGAGLSALAVGFTALAAAGAAGATAIVASLTVIITGVASLIPAVIEKIGEGVISFANVISNGMPVIMEAVRQIALGLIQVLVEVTPPVVEALLLFLMTLLEQLANAVPQMVDAGMRLLIGILEGIAAHIQDVVVVALEIVSEFLRGIAEGIPGVVESGVDIVVAFLRAIGDETPRIIDAGFKMVIDFINGLADAIRENTPVLIESIFDLADAIIDGLIDGLTAGISKVTEPIKKLGESILGKFKNVLGIHSPSKEFMYLGQHIGDGLAIGIDNSIGKATKSSSKLAEEIIKYSKKTIEEFQSWIEDKKYYNEISLKEELDAWTLVQQRYKEGTEERKKADKEVYRLQKALVKATYQYSIDWIEEEKYYNRLSLKEELEAWQRVQSRYMEGSEERKKADREVYRLKKELTDKKISLEKEYADTVKSINDDLKRDIQSLNDDYQNALKSRADAIYRSYGLFDKVSAPKYVSSDELIKNLDEQVDSLNTWKDTLDDLSKRGLDPKLIEELREMGPSVLGELTAISNMTDEQLSKYSDLWREKHRLAKKQATAELEGLRIETNRQIEQLKMEAKVKLAEYTKEWKTRMAELLGIVLPTNTNIVISTNDTMNDLIETINSKQVEYNLAGQNVASNLVAGIKSKDASVSNAFIQSISDCLAQIGNKYTDFYDAGKYLVEGFAEGITANTFLAEARARAMAAAAARAAKKELAVNSPSKVGYRIGSFFGLGFVNALGDYESKSYNAGSGIADAAKNGLSNAISKITDVINGDIDTQPTIRPVLDLSDVETGTSKLNALFSRNRAMSISADMKGTAGEEIQNGGNISGTGNTFTFTQYNYSPKALSRIEIYRQTKNQLSMMKGLVKA